MTLEPILAAPLAVKLHLATVLPAAVLGAWQIGLSIKGGRSHRSVGWLYVALMTTTAISALWIREINPGAFSPIHLLIPLTLYGLISGMIAARAGRVRAHRIAMLMVYVAGIVVAGAFTFAPGRILNKVVFG